VPFAQQRHQRQAYLAALANDDTFDIVDDLVGKLLNFGHEYLDGGMK